MRTATRIAFCTAVGTVLLLTGCTKHYYGRPNPRPLPPGHAKKYETYGHNKHKHVPPGHAKKEPVLAQRPQPKVEVRGAPQRQTTNVNVNVYDNDGPSAQPAPVAAPVQTTVYETSEQNAHVPPGQLRKEETYGHQKEHKTPPGQAKKVERSVVQVQQTDVREQKIEKEYKQEYKQEKQSKPEPRHEQQESSSRGKSKKDESESKQDQREESQGNGKKNGKK